MIVETTHIAFDESGFTGSGLLDASQPVFVLASVKLTTSQADTLRQFIVTEASELKFQKLKKYQKFHSQIIKLLQSEIVGPDTVALTVFHKEYSIWAYTVEHLIEPLAKRDGLNFYEGGMNIAFTNLLFYLVPLYCDKDIVEQYKKHFIEMFLYRTEESVLKFYNIVQRLINSCRSKDFASHLSMIMATFEIIDKILLGWDKNNFDFTLSGFIKIIDYWGRRSENYFDVESDDSKMLNHFKFLVEEVKKINLEPQEIGSDRRKLQLPLKLRNINVNSKASFPVQLADILASSANYYYKSLANPQLEDSFSIGIGQTVLPSLAVTQVWPHKAFTPEALDTVHDGGTNLLDSLVDLSKKQK